MPENIVIASDGGPASRAAMDWVIDRARHGSVVVDVVTVEELDWLPVGADPTEYLKAYDDVLTAAEDYLSHHHGVTFRAGIHVGGDPADALADAAASADWLVVGSTRRSAASAVPRGTLALRIAARITSGLVVVPTDWEPGSDGIVAGVAEDGSSDSALESAAAEAARTGSDLVLVHAWSLPAPFTILDAILKTRYPTLEALHRDRLKAAVAKAKALAPRSRVTSILRFGPAVEVLAEVAHDRALVVVGRRRLRPIEKLFLGSVGHDVLVAGSTPVMVVPS